MNLKQNDAMYLVIIFSSLNTFNKMVIVVAFVKSKNLVKPEKSTAYCCICLHFKNIMYMQFALIVYCIKKLLHKNLLHSNAKGA